MLLFGIFPVLCSGNYFCFTTDVTPLASTERVSDE